MNRKLLAFVCFALAALPVFAEDPLFMPGIGLKIGVGQMKSDAKDVLSDRMNSSGLITGTDYQIKDDAVLSKFFLGFDLFLETNQLFTLPRDSSLGLWLGFSRHWEEKGDAGPVIDTNGTEAAARIRTAYYEIPFGLYYKLTLTDTWNVLGGAGAAFGRAEAKVEAATTTGGNDAFYGNTLRVNKIYPFLMAGGECVLINGLNIALDLRYNFAAKFKKDGFVLRDAGGFEAGISLRYFFVD